MSLCGAAEVARQKIDPQQPDPVAGTPVLLALFFVLMMAQFGVRTVQPIVTLYVQELVGPRPDLATLSGIAFSVDDPAKLLDDARKAAFADARAKANIYTEAAGIGLGRVIAISETENNPPVPQPYMMKAMASDAAAAPVPVEAGQLTYDVNVSVEWEIKDTPAN